MWFRESDAHPFVIFVQVLLRAVGLHQLHALLQNEFFVEPAPRLVAPYLRIVVRNIHFNVVGVRPAPPFDQMNASLICVSTPTGSITPLPLKPIVSMTSVLPSHFPTESPMYEGSTYFGWSRFIQIVRHSLWVSKN